MTINMGIRWDATSPGRVSDNKQTNFDFKTGQVIFSSKDDPYLVPWDLNNFGPRLGFALTPFGSPKTVIRAGYGVFFDAKTNVTWNSFATNPTLYQRVYLPEHRLWCLRAIHSQIRFE